MTHDLSLGNYISDQAIILRKGRVVERGPTAAVFDDPRHPYTRMLLASVPALHGGRDVGDLGRMDVARDRSACLYHAQVPDGDASAPASAGNPTMVEVSAGHHVTCATVDEAGGCVQGGGRPAGG